MPKNDDLDSPMKSIKLRPWRTILIVMVSIVLAEIMIMLLIESPITAAGIDTHRLALVLIDALSLGIVISPIVYYLLLRPLRRSTVLELEQRHAFHDGLTGLPTRRLFQEITRHEINAARRNAHSVVVMVVDPARLSEINQIFGYAFGDAVIKEVGDRLKGIFRASDVKARISGDEFGVLLSSVDADAISTVANNIIKSLDNPYHIDDVSINLGITIGIAVFPDHADDESQLIQRARIALSKAKKDLQPYAVFDEAFESNTQDRIKLYNRIRLAIENKEFELFYQPKIDLVSNRLAGAEALIRWHSDLPQLESRLILFSEQVGLIGEITQWVTNEAIRQLGAWQAGGLTIPVSINISVRDLLDDNLASSLLALCKQHQVEPSLITIEITESAIMVHPDKSIGMLHQLKGCGFAISIDDFGIGHSSMAYLRDVPADELKIDQSFIRVLGDDPRNDALIGAMVDLGKKLGLKVVAEGIESEDILRHVRANGCEIVQGYLFSHPLPPDEFVQWVENRTKRTLAGPDGKMPSKGPN